MIHPGCVYAQRSNDNRVEIFGNTGAQIQKALDYGGIGGVVTLGPAFSSNPYVLTAPLLMPSRSTLRGSGSNNTFLTTSAASLDAIYPGPTSCRILDLQLLAPANATGAGIVGAVGGATLDCHVRNCHIEGWAYGVVTNTGGHRWIIRDNIIKFSSTVNLFLGTGSNLCIIQGNQISGDGVSFATGIGVYNAGLNNIIANNHIVNNMFAGYYQLPGSNADGIGNIFNDNFVSGAVNGAGVMFRAASGRLNYWNSILSNIIAGNNLQGIHFDGNNAGGTFRDNIIASNMIYSAASNGIYIDARTTTDITRTSILGNHVVLCGGTGILLFNSALCVDAQVKSNTVFANTAAQITTTGTTTTVLVV